MTARIWQRMGRALCLLAGAATLLTGCRQVPVTGRRQLLLQPENKEVEMGISAYSEVMATERVSSDRQAAELVNRVGQRIAKAADRPDFQWEFRLIASSEQNAFCLPGGKVAVYEGILPICQNEAGLAVVMSHEIAHALARHGGERMSQNYASNGVGKLVGYAMRNQEEKTRAIAMQAYGLGAKYGAILPYSRKHESEADHIGMMLMAQAGYDPAEAPRFWTRFASAKDGQHTPEWASTHPSDERRAHDLSDLLVEASTHYAKSPTKYGLGESITLAAAPRPTASPAKLGSERASENSGQLPSLPGFDNAAPSIGPTIGSMPFNPRLRETR